MGLMIQGAFVSWNLLEILLEALLEILLEMLEALLLRHPNSPTFFQQS